MSDEELIDPETKRYRSLVSGATIRQHWVEQAADIPAGATFAGLGREKLSYRGVAAHRGLTTLYTAAVNQDFLDEICELENLEHLWLGWPVTATDLNGLKRLKKLRYLKIETPRAITDFSPLTELPALRSLFIENARYLTGLDWLAPLRSQLWALGIEGSMWTMQKLPGLAPLAGFGFEALFLTSVQLKDKDLMPLADCANLRFLAPARFAPKPRFEELKAARPNIACIWFDQYETR